MGKIKHVVTGTTGQMSKQLTGLTTGTTYYIRPYAKNAHGIFYGETKTVIPAYVPSWREVFPIANSSTHYSQVEISANGQYIIATNGGTPGVIHQSRDFGDTWRSISIDGGYGNIRMSSDGQQIISVGVDTHAFISRNAGDSWSTLWNSYQYVGRAVTRLGMSKNGKYIVRSYQVTYSSGIGYENISTSSGSTDYGASSNLVMTSLRSDLGLCPSSNLPILNDTTHFRMLVQNYMGSSYEGADSHELNADGTVHNASQLFYSGNRLIQTLASENKYYSLTHTGKSGNLYRFYENSILKNANVPLSHFVVSPDNTVLLGNTTTGTTIKKSVDGGATWTDFPTGLSLVAKGVSNGGNVIVATFGNKLYVYR